MSERESEKDTDKGFTVIDRRGSAGEGEKAQPERPQGPEPSGPGAAGSAAPGTEGRGAAERELPRIDFATFCLSLSTSALYHMGAVKHPETGETSEPNLPLARQTIDTLEMLEEKTRGNLEEEERKLLQSLLYELRMQFVEATRSAR